MHWLPVTHVHIPVTHVHIPVTHVHIVFVSAWLAQYVWEGGRQSVMCALQPLLPEGSDRTTGERRPCRPPPPRRPRIRTRVEAMDLPDGIRLMDPAGYLDFLALQASAKLVLTDSGGLQEETTILGVPCLTLRENTERPITIDEGTNQLAGTDPERIVTLAHEILDGNGPEPRRPDLWDGNAASRIADAISG